MVCDDDQSTNFLITSRILSLLHFFSRNASKFFLRIVFEIYFGLIFYPQNYALISNWQLYFRERKQETGGVTRDEKSCVYSGGSNPRNTNRWTEITAQT